MKALERWGLLIKISALIGEFLYRALYYNFSIKALEHWGLLINVFVEHSIITSL